MSPWKREQARILGYLSDESLGLFSRKRGAQKRKYSLRLAARAVLLDGKTGKIALMNVSRKNYHKLPGGGLFPGEPVLAALRREIREETGCLSARIGRLVGVVVERRNRFRLVQISYCYLAEVSRKGQPKLEKGELAEGFRLEWLSPAKAEKLLAT